MKIAILCGGGEPPFSSTQGLIRGFKQLGHDVWTLGRAYYNRSLCDVELENRQYIEWYSYGEILEQCPWTPDFILNIDPGGYFNGEKPKNIPCALFSTDAHRNGSLLRQVIKKGNFDYFFNSQPVYTDFFTDIVKTIVVLPAVDESRFDLTINIEPECDISFVGQSGLALFDMYYDCRDDVGRYVSNLKDKLPSDHKKYLFANMPSYDYAERAELLYRLSQDFSVRIYEPIWDEKLQFALQKGKIGFNRSILNDVSIRNFEVAMSARPLITDDIDHSKVTYPYACVIYQSGYYRPFYQNFDLEYQVVKKSAEAALNETDRKTWGEYSRIDILKKHTWKNRAEQIIKIISTNK